MSDSSVLKLRNFEIYRKSGNKESNDDVMSQPAFWRRLCLHIHPAWAFCVAYSDRWQRRPEYGVSKCSGLRFFMDLSGNKDLLDRELVAFFASRKATPHDTQLALQWAAAICQTNKVVISGFHSPLEKEILNYLLERKHPVIFALGRALYKKVPPHLQTAFDEGNLLFISFRDYTRHSWNSAQQRNWGAADLANEIYFTQFDNTSSLSTLHFTLDRYSDKAVYVLE